MTDTQEETEIVQQPPRYVDPEGRVYYRASSLGMCNRIFVALSQFYEPAAHPQWFQEVLDEGTRSEQTIIDHYENQQDVVVVETQQTAMLEILPNVFIVGHIDGEAWFTQDEMHGVEIKKIRDGQWGRFLKSGVEYLPNYPWQVSAYWFGRGWESCDVVGGRFVDGEITEIHVHQLTAPPIPLAGLRRRIIELEVAINDSSHVLDTPCNIRQYPCPFYYLHDAEDQSEPPTRPADDIIAPILTELIPLQRELTAANAKVKEIEGRVKELKAGTSGWLVASGAENKQVVRVDVGDRAYEISATEIDRDGYIVPPTSYTLVKAKDVTPPKEGEVAVAKKRAPRKKAEGGTTKKAATKAGGTGKGESRPVASLLDPATQPATPDTTKLPKRPNLKDRNITDAE